MDERNKNNSERMSNLRLGEQVKEQLLETIVHAMRETRQKGYCEHEAFHYDSTNTTRL